MELNEHHYQNVVNFLKFSRYRRGTQLRAVDSNFEDCLASRVALDETYTGDEVDEILRDLNGVVRADVESELLDSNHTNCLLLRQLFRQAEKWHLKLNIDTAELENKALLDEVAKLEDTSANALKKEGKTKLTPLQDSGPVPLLQMEIGRLEEENNKLRQRLEKLEMDTTNIMSEKGTLQEQVKLLTIQSQVPGTGGDSNQQQISAMATEIEGLRRQLASASVTSPGNTVPDDYVATKHQLLAVQADLERTQGELDKKFSETTQYNNLKKMLAKKNDQMKDLRSRLRKYEPTDD